MNKKDNKIKVGYRVGQLTVIGKTDERRHGYIVWKCRCDCGNEIDLDTRFLQRGSVKDCGCISGNNAIIQNLTGKRFGKLVCKKPEDENSGSKKWICQCDCGNICTATVSQLQSGNKKSCGCLSKPAVKDYVGKRFNMLTVIEYAGKVNGEHKWKCLCDCGNETIVGQTRLQIGRTKSCGCLKKTQIEKRFRVTEGTSPKALEARMNGKLIASNTSGYNGVFQTKRGTWIAQITFKKKTHYLGSFSNIDEAIAARKKAEEMYKSFLDRYYTQQSDSDSANQN